LFYLITNRDCVALPSERRPLRKTRLLLCALQIATTTLVVKSSSTPPAVIDGPPPRTWPASPVAYVRREVGAGAAETCGAPGAALSREVGVRAAGTRDAPGAVLRQEVGAGAQVTRDAPGAALSREVRVGAMGTHGTPGAALSQEVGAGAAGTRGAPKAALRRETGAGAQATRGGPEPGGGYHSIAPSSAPFCGRSGRGAIPIRPPLPLPGRHPTRVAPPPPSTTSTTTTTSTSATSASKGYHLHVVLTGFLLQSQHSRHSDATTAGDVSSSDSSFDLYSSLTVCGAPAVTAGGGDVRVYLIGYIFCIIDCHICWDIFGRIDII
jgi:hypothetical protein